MKPKAKPRTQKSRLQLLHQYYSYTGFYAFVWKSFLKALPYILGFVLLVFLIEHFFGINQSLIHLTEVLPIPGVLLFFFASEVLLGLIPPEIFIAWAGKLDQPWLYLSFIAVLSYIGGLISYWIGRGINSLPKVHNYIHHKMKRTLKNSKKWGGLLIMAGAILPIPFSTACMAAGIIEFSFKNVVLFGSLRLVRYLIYGIIIFGII